MHFVVVDADGKEKIDINAIRLVQGSELTISSGEITVGARSFYRIDTEGDAATDDLDTINGGVGGQLLILASTTSVRDPTLKNATGNLRLAGDFTLDGANDRIMLMCQNGIWVELSRSTN